MKFRFVKCLKIIFFVLFYAEIEAVTTSLPQDKTLRFRENKGQVCDQYYKPRQDVLFSGSDGKMVYHLKRGGISYQLSKTKSWKNVDNASRRYPNNDENTAKEAEEIIIYRVDLNWLNCNTNAAIRTGETIDGYENFYLESCPQGALKVKSYKDVTYKNLYPGIDLKWYEKNGQLKYDYNIAAGADYKQMRIELNGATSLNINGSGQLVVTSPLGEIIEDAPLAEQGGKSLPIKWKINGNIISFQIDEVDPLLPFTIDPLVRLWGTFYGGTQVDEILGSCTDANNNLIVTGRSRSSNGTTIATVGSYQVSYGGQATTGSFAGDSFLAEFNSAGIRQWATYYGGSGNEFGVDCKADNSGNIYLVGVTSSTNSSVMSTPGCHQPVKIGPSGSNDAFIAKFNSQGFRIWGSYYGDVSEDLVGSLCIDFNGDIYFTGWTSLVTTGTVTSNAIATPGCFQPNHGPMGSSVAPDDAFLVKFSQTGSRIWGTYFGAEGNDQGSGCVADLAGNIYIVGCTSSTTSAVMTTSGCHQSVSGSTNPASLPGDGFIAKFSGSGVRLWSTYYGGPIGDIIYNCFVDNAGDLYFGGYTENAGGTVIATPGSHQSTHGGGFTDAFFGKFSAQGARLWGSYYGGPGFEFGCVVCKTSNGFCVAGNSGFGWPGGTNNPNLFSPQNAGTLIATPCVYQYNYGSGQNDAFLSKFDFNGNRIWGTYYGGAGDEGQACTLTVDGLDNIYLCGKTTALSNSLVIASPSGFQNTYGGGTSDGFIVKFGACIPVQPSLPSNLEVCKGKPAVLNVVPNCSLNWYSDSLLTNLIYSGGNFTSNPIFYDTTFYYVDVSCGSPSAKTVAHVTVVTGPPIAVNNSLNPIIICKGETVTLIPSGPNSYTWSNSPGPYILIVSPQSTTVYTVTGMLLDGSCPTQTTVTVLVNDCLGITESSATDDLVLQLYPNPSNESFTLSGNKPTRVFIYDEYGKILSKINLSASNQFKSIVEGLSSGIYFIRAESDSIITSKKITVLK